jgi:uncharacterized protein YegL
MPDLSSDMEDFQLQTSHYGFSAERVENLAATEYTLVTILFDKSSSTLAFRKEMKDATDKVVEACKKSPRADNLLIRAGAFDTNFSEIHGFRQLATIQDNEYDSLLSGGGMTALNDASINGIEAMSSYGKTLVENDFSVNAICFIISDGCDNNSSHAMTAVKKTLQDAVQLEVFESLVTVLVGVNLASDTAQALQDFQQVAGMTQFVNIGDATPQKLAKLAEFVSKSISATSQSLGSGSSSQQIQSTVVF